ncbi:protein RTA1 [Cladorrhinum samala]|uniref:Protein RTA1 n=1 Tax=Cladorrhinum samala TaxID=585594 RepID=A0AAV9HZK9_9PEZI|nr:protein RTA1 [Cladorrhinum samala]
MSDGNPVPGSFWFYAPNKGAAIFFTIAFAASGLFHLYQCIHLKSFRYTFYLPISCILFTVGFALRIYGAFDPSRLAIYLISTLTIYMSPPILELSNYHVLGRLFYYVPYLSPFSIHPGRVLTTFGSLSSAAEVLNGLGVAYLANRSPSNKYYALGHNLMRACLVLQIVIILAFLLFAARFHAQCARNRVATARVGNLLASLYASMGLILVRTVYRCVEHFSVSNVRPGSSSAAAAAAAGDLVHSLSPVIRYEWFFYVFEAAPMLVNAAMWNARHPGRYLPRSYRTYLAQDGQTEIEGPGWEDQRGVVMSVIDPFGLVAMCEKGRGGVRFWEENGYHHLLGAATKV